MSTPDSPDSKPATAAKKPVSYTDIRTMKPVTYIIEVKKQIIA